MGFDGLTFEVKKSEVPFLRNEAVSVCSIHHLRPFGRFSQQVYFIDFGANAINRFAIRRIAMHLTTRPRSRWGPQQWKLDELVFLVHSESQGFAVSAFKGKNALLADQAVLGPFPEPDDPKLVAVLHWDTVESSGIVLPDSLYIRTERKRSRLACTRSFVAREIPDLLSLFDQVKSLPAMTQAEEDLLFIQLRRSDVKARDRLVLQMLPLVFDHAFRVYKANEMLRPVFADLFSGGVEGLMIAIEKYEFERGHRFSTFCWSWIANKTERVMVESLWPIEVPYYAWERLGPAARKYDDASCASRAPGQYDSIESRLGLSEQDLPILRLLVGENYVQDDEDLLEQFLDESSSKGFEEIDEGLALLDVLGCLKDRDRNVLLLRWGCHPDFDEPPLTLEEVGRRLHLTRERVRQIEVRAIGILKKTHGLEA